MKRSLVEAAMRENGFPIRVLVKKTGVSRQTVHFYLREGLLPRPRKRAANVAVYDERHVSAIRRIRELRSSYIPLRVVKALVGERYGETVRRIRRRLSVPAAAADLSVCITDREVRRRTGLTASELGMLKREGIISPEAGTGGVWSGDDLNLATLVGEIKRTWSAAGRMSRVIRGLAIYADPVRAIVEEETRRFISRLPQDADMERIAHLARSGIDIYGRFMLLFRERLIRAKVAAILAERRVPAAPPVSRESKGAAR